MTITNTSEIPAYAIDKNVFFDGVFRAVDGDASASDLLLTGDLDYTVSKQPLFSAHPDGMSDPKRLEKFSVVWGKDNLTGSQWMIEAPVGAETYTTLQNHPIVDAAAEVGQAGAGLINWRGVATFQSKARVAMWGTIDEEFTLPGGDKHQRIASLVWSHDGGWSLGFKASIGRIWCGNVVPGIILSTNRRSTVRIKHTRSGEVKLQTLAEQIVANTVDVQDYERLFLKLYDRKVEPADLDKFLQTVAPVDQALAAAPEHLLTAGQKRSLTMARNKQAAIRDIFLNSGTQENLRWTAVGLWHAAIEALDHRASGDRGWKIIDGQSDAAKRQALEVALAI